MRKGLAAAFSFALLTGCASTPPPQPTASFNPAEAQYSRARGTATVKGQAFLRRNDGVVVYGAGSDVMLIPKTSYADEVFQASFKGRKLRMEVRLFGNAGPNLMNNDYSLDPAMEAFVRRQKADGQGNFAFESIPPGEYFILTRVTWCVPSRYGCEQQGGDLLETVRVAPTDKVLNAMLTGA